MIRFVDPEKENGQYALDRDVLTILHTDEGVEWWDLNADGEPCENETDLLCFVRNAPIPDGVKDQMSDEISTGPVYTNVRNLLDYWGNDIREWGLESVIGPEDEVRLRYRYGDIQVEDEFYKDGSWHVSCMEVWTEANTGTHPADLYVDLIEQGFVRTNR